MSERKKKLSLGDTFGKLVLIEQYREPRASGNGFKYLSKFKCDCGGERIVETGNLKHSAFNYECLSCSGNAGGKQTHGGSVSRKDIEPEKHRVYSVWQAMKRRCYKTYDKRYADYGGRGIKICDAWLTSFDNFLRDMGIPPKSMQIDRIDNEGDYSPDNCRWATQTENSRNKRNSKWITANGETKTQAEWSEITGIKREAISQRLRRGWSPEKALGLVTN